MKHLHISDVRAFKQCRVQWHFSSPRRLGYAPKVQARALRLGTLVHNVLDLWFSDMGSDIGALADSAVAEDYERVEEELSPADFREALPKYEEVWDQVNPIAVNFADNFYMPGLEIYATENDFVVPLVKNQIALAGRWDVVARRGGKIWIVDHKVSGADFNWYSHYLQTLDEQARAYCWAGYRVWKEDFGGIIYNLIRNKAPRKPKVLKSGKFSTNARQDTTWKVYSETVAAAGQDPNDYIEMKEILDARPSYNRFVEVTFRPSMLQAFGKSLRQTSVEILADPVIYPNGSFMNCRGCPFQDPCWSFNTSESGHFEEMLKVGYVASDYAQAAIDLEQSNS